MSESTNNSIVINGKARYYEAAPHDIDVDNFRKVVTSRRSVRKFTNKPIPQAVLDDCLDMALLAPARRVCNNGNFM